MIILKSSSEASPNGTCYFFEKVNFPQRNICIFETVHVWECWRMNMFERVCSSVRKCLCLCKCVCMCLRQVMCGCVSVLVFILCLYVCGSVYLCSWVSGCVSVCFLDYLCICLTVRLCLCGSLNLWVYVSESLCVPVCVSVPMSALAFVCLSAWRIFTVYYVIWVVYTVHCVECILCDCEECSKYNV